jgi:type II secretory pathway predicted ATPase ExeA
MEQEKIQEVLKNYKKKSNKDLIQVLDFLYEDFNKTKELIVKLTHHLDSTEISYNKLLEEINSRIKQ